MASLYVRNTTITAEMLKKILFSTTTGPHTGPMIDFLFLGKTAQYVPTSNIKSAQGLLLILCELLSLNKQAILT